MSERPLLRIRRVKKTTDIRPDVEIEDQNGNLIAVVFNQSEGEPAIPTKVIAQTFVDSFNQKDN